jgi:hypothetical protein
MWPQSKVTEADASARGAWQTGQMFSEQWAADQARAPDLIRLSRTSSDL